MQHITVRQLIAADLNNLAGYLAHLSDASKSRFGPHAFDIASLSSFYNDPSVTGYIAVDNTTTYIIAYAIVKEGLLQHDRSRILSYQYPFTEQSCCTYAPSVADAWQGKGVGKIVFEYIRNRCAEKNYQQVVLWGGVQATNEIALQYYKKLGFIKLGEFEYNGINHDMVLELY